MSTPAPARRTPAQFARFLVVGVVNTAFGYGVFAALVLAGFAPGPALVGAYLLGVPFNFFTTGHFVFRPGGPAAFARFVAAYVVVYFFNAGLYALLARTGLAALAVQALCLPVVAVFSFLLFKLAVFKGSR